MYTDVVYTAQVIYTMLSITNNIKVDLFLSFQTKSLFSSKHSPKTAN